MLSGPLDLTDPLRKPWLIMVDYGYGIPDCSWIMVVMRFLCRLCLEAELSSSGAFAPMDWLFQGAQISMPLFGSSCTHVTCYQCVEVWKVSPGVVRL